MKIILFGASGQLGLEWQTYFTSRKSEEFNAVTYTSSQLDITQREKVAHEVDRHQPDLIINCAAYTKVDKAEEERDKARKVNAEAMKSIAELCSDFAIKLVHFSTDYVFAGRKADRARFPKGYPEDHDAEPVNWYGQTKWEGEQAIRNSGCEHLIMRVSWLCGAYGSNFVTTMLRLAEDHQQLRVVDDQWGSPTFTDYLVKNTYQLIEQEQEGTYHFSSEGTINWATFAEAIFDLSEKDVKVNSIPSSEYPTEAARPFFSKLNTDKIKQVDRIQTDGWKTGLSRLLKQINTI